MLELLAVVLAKEADRAEVWVLIRGEVAKRDVTFEEAVARELVRLAAIQRLLEKHGFDRETAEEVGVGMLRGFSEWG